MSASAATTPSSPPIDGVVSFRKRTGGKVEVNVLPSPAPVRPSWPPNSRSRPIGVAKGNGRRSPFSFPEPRHEVPRPGQDLRPLRQRRRGMRRAFAARSSSSSAGPTAATAARGGDVILECVDGLNTLIDYRYAQHFKAETGHHGMGSQRTGGAGKDIVLRAAARHPDLRRGQRDPARRPHRDRPERGARQGRRRRLRQPALQELDQPRAASRRQGLAGRGALGLAAAEADRRYRPGRPAQRRQVDVPCRDLERAAQDRRLPVHHAASRAGRREGRRRASS